MDPISYIIRLSSFQPLIPSLSISLTYPEQLNRRLSLAQGDLLKLSFRLHLIPEGSSEGDEGKPHKAHQAFLRLRHIETGDEVSRPFSSSAATGRYKLDLKLKRGGTFFKNHPGRLEVTLIIGSFQSSSPIIYPLGEITSAFPDLSQNKDAPEFSPEDEEWTLRPEIHHIFREDQKMPPLFLSQVFAALTFSPWLLLLPLWAYLGANTKRAPWSSPIELASNILFLGSLVGFAYIYAMYWLRVTLFPTLGALAAVGLVALFTGQHSLSALARRRVKETKKE
ncbi:Dolichyl-diphosphooligosaccharide--protein glycosyltransferase subunit Swp1 [Piptocephalis cylindrospora]|uniref:Ribophorin II n=1 Tax=Piptocephalis cylindrospora TaxID=1907219 RepID=A0A4P9Y441_9FUNG|nr:Dolichyl-diphosphooligosaccharide--protein glycosyltransferase subunit Swp1 [Piptocephalis cylindrospora]|eukprot:RKP13726.1 Dolichyl-diphosphooligosaccharide--protein glycosyltransferase subunit Swp1 [Piptocephalis cylindrospora]